MKLVLFSDIHANLPALEAFFKQLETTNYQAIYCLGDLVGYNIWPNEIVQAIQSRKIPTLAGNHDVVVGMETEKPSGVFTNAVIGASEKEYLRSLPAHISLDFRLKHGELKVLFVHGSPRRNNEYLLEETSDAYLLELLDEANADVLCCAHTHKPFHRAIAAKNKFKHIVNIGSLGKPKDGDQRGCFAVLDIDENSNLEDESGISVSFERVAYDVEKAAQAVEQNDILPNKFAEALRIAK